MVLELVQPAELWVVLPDGSNVRIDCRGKGPAVVEYWHDGQRQEALPPAPAQSRA